MIKQLLYVSSVVIYMGRWCSTAHSQNTYNWNNYNFRTREAGERLRHYVWAYVGRRTGWRYHKRNKLLRWLRSELNTVQFGHRALFYGEFAFASAVHRH